MSMDHLLALLSVLKSLRYSSQPFTEINPALLESGTGLMSEAIIVAAHI